MKGYKTLDSVKLNGKRVLLRVDLNSAVVNGKVELSDRMIAHVRTIKELMKKKTKLVVIAHQGRKGDDDFTSLAQHAKLLSKFVKIKFVDDINGKKATDAITKLKDGEALLLENLRFSDDELKPGDENNPLVNSLAKYFDYYVNDAFSVSHRDQASVTGFPKVLPGLIGRVMAEEIEGAEKIKKSKPLFILGGAKPSEHIDLLKAKDHATVLATGLFANVCAVANGFNFGKENSILEEKKIMPDKDLIDVLKKHKVYLPEDYAIEKDGKRVELTLKEFPSEYAAMDIGKKTVEKYSSLIKNAKVVLMKGPAGKYEDKKFMQGTKGLFDAIIKSKVYSILAGGNTLSAMKHLNIPRARVSHVSLAGGAFIEYLAGKKLPGLEVLRVR